MNVNPTAAADKWLRNLSTATESMKSGINAVTVSPTEKAAQQVDAYVAGINRSVADGTYQSGLRKVTLEDWKRAMLDKGVARVAAGASAAKPKMQAFLSEFLPFVQAGVDALSRMPRGDLQTNIARAVAMMEHNARFSRRS